MSRRTSLRIGFLGALIAVAAVVGIIFTGTTSASELSAATNEILQPAASASAGVPGAIHGGEY